MHMCTKHAQKKGNIPWLVATVLQSQSQPGTTYLSLGVKRRGGKQDKDQKCTRGLQVVRADGEGLAHRWAYGDM